RFRRQVRYASAGGAVDVPAGLLRGLDGLRRVLSHSADRVGAAGDDADRRDDDGDARSDDACHDVLPRFEARAPYRTHKARCHLIEHRIDPKSRTLFRSNALSGRTGSTTAGFPRETQTHVPPKGSVSQETTTIPV